MNRQGHRERRPRRSLSLGCLITILILLVLVFGVVLLSSWLDSQTQSYNEFSNYIRVGQVQVIQTKIPHLMLAELITFSDGGQQESKFRSQVPGDEWKLEGNIITCPGTDTCSGVLNVLGLHSGYKLTHWIGHYTSISKSDSTIDINSGDDNFFKMVSNHTTPIVSATEISTNFLRPDGKTYNLFVSPTGMLLISSN